MMIKVSKRRLPIGLLAALFLLYFGTMMLPLLTT